MTSRHLLFAAVLLAAPLSAAPVLAAPAAPPARTAITAPLELTKTRHLAVRVKINGQGPFRLVLDTGAPLSFISGRVAAQIGLLKPEAAGKPAFFGMRGQTVLKSASLGGAEVKGLTAMILDHPIVQALDQIDPPLDGIMGFSFFARYRTTLDYQAGRITLVPVSYVPQDVLSGIMAQMTNPSASVRSLAPRALWGFTVAKPDDQEGVSVTHVFPKSAADAAGLKPGDRLLTLDSRWTESDADTWEAAAGVKPGQPVTVTVRRDGEVRELKIAPRPGL